MDVFNIKWNLILILNTFWLMADTNSFNNNILDESNLLSEYDFIIVGGGTAGCVLANRLTEIPDWKVLLVEAGGDQLFTDIPIKIGYNQLTPVNWNYKTEPSNRYCQGLTNKQCLWPRGKIVGGSSAINYMIYTRGSPDDYNNWEELGNDGWGWQDVLPYFKKLEHFNIPELFNSKYHNKNGHVNVEYAPYQSAISKFWIKAAEEIGFQNVDYNDAETPSGVSRFQLTIKNGTHHTSARAYLYPIKNRLNLHVIQNSLVRRLIFDDTNTTVIGIEMNRNDKTYRILATKEVIVSAGTINSPQLLMLSGIGPYEHLDTMHIQKIKNLPVGYNLKDHVSTGVHFIANSNTLGPHLKEEESLNEWLHYHRGPLSIPGGSEAVIYTNLNDKFNHSLLPDMELILCSSGFNLDPLLKHIFGVDDKFYAEVFESLGNQTSFIVFPLLMRPKSKGRLFLQSKDPNVHPKIVPNYFEIEEDLRKVVEGIKISIEISKQPSMKKLGVKIYDKPVKQCLEEGIFGSDNYFACYVRMFTFTLYHPTGTCKMGIESDPTAVVDNRLRVHGIKNLRVIDASIIPEAISVHINTATFMIAEKGADMIKNDWSSI